MALLTPPRLASRRAVPVASGIMPDPTIPLLFTDADAMARAAAIQLLELSKAAVAERGIFTLALSGGSTPKKLYALLGKDPAFATFPWAQTHLYFGDERHVAPDDAESNFRMVKESLLNSGLVPAENVHRVFAELESAAQAASEYEAQMRRDFEDKALLDGFPRFDVVLLGMGPDGHTASLFPGSAALDEKTKWVAANWVEKFKTDRITFTFPVLNAARVVLLLIAGADKAPMIRQVLGDARGTYPVERVQPADGVKVWMLDHAAAAELGSPK
jgi:6-phosphogluconolactonase